MRERLRSLQRLAALYHALEHANGIALDHARGALQEVEDRIHDKAAAEMRLSESSLKALREGDLHEWLMDRSQIQFTQWNAAALGGLRKEREAALREAAEIYQASRMQFEQMQSVVDEVGFHVAREEERTEQRTSDDRYLSRQRWEESAGERLERHGNGDIAANEEENLAGLGESESFDRSA